jgi:hypothetical protein
MMQELWCGCEIAGGRGTEENRRELSALHMSGYIAGRKKSMKILVTITDLGTST